MAFFFFSPSFFFSSRRRHTRCSRDWSSDVCSSDLPISFALEDGSGLAAGNLVTPHAFTQLLAYMHRHPKRAPFLAALPHSGQPGSLLKRFAGTAVEGRVIAKTGSIDRVNSLSGFIERPNGRTITFSIQANTHAVPYQQMLAQIDSVVVEIGKTSR